MATAACPQKVSFDSRISARVQKRYKGPTGIVNEAVAQTLGEPRLHFEGVQLKHFAISTSTESKSVERERKAPEGRCGEDVDVRGCPVEWRSWFTVPWQLVVYWSLPR